MGLASGHPRVPPAAASHEQAPRAPRAGTKDSLLACEIGLEKLAVYLDFQVETWKGPGCKSEEHRQRKLAELAEHIKTVQLVRERIRPS